MRIEKSEVREWYTNEAIERQLSVRQLERQLYAFTYERTLTHQINVPLSTKASETTATKDILKDPYILEFTGLQKDSSYHETDLEKALISNIEAFLLELGKWFTFMPVKNISKQSRVISSLIWFL